MMWIYTQHASSSSNVYMKKTIIFLLLILLFAFIVANVYTRINIASSPVDINRKLKTGNAKNEVVKV